MCWSASVFSSCLGDPENDCSDNSSWRRTGELISGISSSSPLQAGGAGGLEFLSDSHSLFAADMASGTQSCVQTRNPSSDSTPIYICNALLYSGLYMNGIHLYSLITRPGIQLNCPSTVSVQCQIPYPVCPADSASHYATHRERASQVSDTPNIINSDKWGSASTILLTCFAECPA